MNGFRGKGMFDGGYEREDQLFSETEKLLALYIEKGASWDPQKLTSVRQQLYQNFSRMGVLGAMGNLNAQAYGDLACKIARIKDTPVKPNDFPSQKLFKARYLDTLKEKPDLVNIKGRTDKPSEEYLYGVGILMANQPAYEALFKDDPIIVRKGQVENGRHRSLAKDVLDKCGYSTSGWSWVKTDYED